MPPTEIQNFSKFLKFVDKETKNLEQATKTQADQKEYILAIANEFFNGSDNEEETKHEGKDSTVAPISILSTSNRQSVEMPNLMNQKALMGGASATQSDE